MPLDQHVRNAEAAEEERGGQAHEGTADDEDGYLVVGSVVHRCLQERGAGGGAACGAHRSFHARSGAGSRASAGSITPVITRVVHTSRGPSRTGSGSGSR
ncbi:hypothetical protein GCM10009564_40740 [Streptomyces thermogriseus]|uniref:Uncharacterized protein n=1 Tax=Streptomyces thermogriseus TaxID=75292 RepID=A0ABP4DKS6_9ACTN